MIEEDFQVFIDSVINYFQQMNDADIVVDTPYLNENQTPIFEEYTGVIGISGNNKGLVYFTASKPMLLKILQIIQETDDSEDNLVDLVGEVANTISGNARRKFGDEFNISVPFVFKGQPETVLLPKDKDKHTFIIPLKWNDHQAFIGIYLNGKG